MVDAYNPVGLPNVITCIFIEFIKKRYLKLTFIPASIIIKIDIKLIMIL
jgi:hypothetical protein